MLICTCNPSTEKLETSEAPRLGKEPSLISKIQGSESLSEDGWELNG